MHQEPGGSTISEKADDNNGEGTGSELSKELLTMPVEDDTEELVARTTDASLVSGWTQFFELNHFAPKIRDIADIYPEKKSLPIDFKDIDRFDSVIANHLLLYPQECLTAGEIAIQEFMMADQKVPIHLRITGLFKEVHNVDVRNLRIDHIGKLIQIDGMITQATPVKPRILEATFECLRCHAQHRVFQATEIFREPLECSKEAGGCGRAAASTVFHLLPYESVFVDRQKFELQEHMEDLPGARQPQKIVFFGEDDIVSKTTTGDHVRIVAILEVRIKRKGLAKLTDFDTYMNAVSIEIMEQPFEEIEISEEDKTAILELGKDFHIFDRIVDSIAVNIMGCRTQKEALALQLFGGISKTTPSGTRLRGDIHIFMAGDPGTAKTQLCRGAATLSPRAVMTAGPDATPKSLNAVCEKNEFSEGQFSIKGGAGVMADRGLLFIDEFDKSDPYTPGALHAPLETQRIEAHKGGVYAQFWGRYSFLATMNPLDGRFDDFSPLVDQILKAHKGLSASFLSRMDAVFVMRDRVSPEKDKKVAVHILDMHLQGQKNANEEWNKDTDATIRPDIDQKLLRKYVAYAKRNIFPIFDRECRNFLLTFYMDLRGRRNNTGEPVAISPRQLNTLVRFSEARARLELSKTITLEHAKKAVELYIEVMEPFGALDDIDTLVSGVSTAQRDRYRTIITTLRALRDVHPNGVPHEVLVEEASFQIPGTHDIGTDIETLILHDRIFVASDDGQKHYKAVV